MFKIEKTIVGNLPNRDLRNKLITFIKSKKHAPRNDFEVYKQAFSCEDGTIWYLGNEDTGIPSTRKEFSALKDIDWTYVAKQIY